MLSVLVKRSVLFCRVRSSLESDESDVVFFVDRVGSTEVDRARGCPST